MVGMQNETSNSMRPTKSRTPHSFLEMSQFDRREVGVATAVVGGVLLDTTQVYSL
jgi:hypothetical protein